MSTMSDKRKDFLCSILSTAIESGIDYWAIINKYHWKMDEHLCFTSCNGKITVYSDDENDGKEFTLTIHTISKGLHTILDHPEFEISSDLYRYISWGDRNNDAGDIDSDCADVILQAALFGEIIYG